MIKIQDYYSSSSRALLSHGSSSVAGQRASVSQSENKNADSSPVLVDISRNVYDAVEDFLYLNGNDRVESYMSLSQQDKEKYLRILDRLQKKGALEKEKLTVAGADDPDIIKKEMDSRPYLKSLFYNDDGSVAGG